MNWPGAASRRIRKMAPPKPSPNWPASMAIARWPRKAGSTSANTDMGRRITRRRPRPMLRPSTRRAKGIWEKRPVISWAGPISKRTIMAGEQAFAAQLANYPQGPLAADAAFMVGESLFKQEQYEKALAALQKAHGHEALVARFHRPHAAPCRAGRRATQALGRKPEAGLPGSRRIFPTRRISSRRLYERAGRSRISINSSGSEALPTVADKTDAWSARGPVS